MLRSAVLLSALALFVIAFGMDRRSLAPAAGQRPAPPRSAPAAPVEIQIRNVNYRISRDVVLEIRTLRGELRRTRADVPVTFDDSSSFEVDIDSGEVAMTAASLSSLLNSYVFAESGAPVRNFRVSIQRDRLTEKGTLRKGLDLPFEITASVSVTGEGAIRLHTEKITSVHVPVGRLLHFFGESPEKIMGKAAARGILPQGDDMILELPKLTPAPHLRGRVSRVALTNDRMVQFFSSDRRPAALDPPLPTGSYIYHRGGTLRFGKLTMSDADVEIVADRPGAFDFFQREYLRQLVAGYSKTTRRSGLVVHMADYNAVADSGNTPRAE